MSSEQSSGQTSGEQTGTSQQQHQHQGLQHQGLQQPATVTQLSNAGNENYVCQWVGCGTRAETPETLYVSHFSTILTA